MAEIEREDSGPLLIDVGDAGGDDEVAELSVGDEALNVVIGAAGTLLRELCDAGKAASQRVADYGEACDRLGVHLDQQECPVGDEVGVCVAQLVEDCGGRRWSGRCVRRRESRLDLVETRIDSCDEQLLFPWEQLEDVCGGDPCFTSDVGYSRPAVTASGERAECGRDDEWSS